MKIRCNLCGKRVEEYVECKCDTPYCYKCFSTKFNKEPDDNASEDLSLQCVLCDRRKTLHHLQDDVDKNILTSEDVKLIKRLINYYFLHCDEYDFFRHDENEL